jgi:hypothetical protein
LTYTGTVLRCLISCPGDVPLPDLATVHQEINRWNGVYGPKFATAITPISWGTHAAAEFGQPPQEILNRQIVDACDICIAIFANRLGTPTATAESGTAEEIERLYKAGKYVAVLRSRRAVKPGYDLHQAQRLEDYLGGLSALVLDYEDEAQLVGRVNNILAAAASRDRTLTETELEPARRRSADVWPRVEREDKVSAGRSAPARNWYLALTNMGTAPARNVRFHTEAIKAEDIPWEIAGAPEGEEPTAEVLPPNGGEVRFPIGASMENSSQVRGIVTWTDDRGEHTNVATLQL